MTWYVHIASQFQILLYALTLSTVSSIPSISSQKNSIQLSSQNSMCIPCCYFLASLFGHPSAWYRLILLLTLFPIHDPGLSSMIWFVSQPSMVEFVWTASSWGCKWNILCTYIRNVKIVMHDPYCIHIWHLNLPCGFADNFLAMTWHVLVKSKQIVCITHLIITWRNKWVCKIGKSANKLWFFICCM